MVGIIEKIKDDLAELFSIEFCFIQNGIFMEVVGENAELLHEHFDFSLFERGNTILSGMPIVALEKYRDHVDRMGISWAIVEQIGRDDSGRIVREVTSSSIDDAMGYRSPDVPASLSPDLPVSLVEHDLFTVIQTHLDVGRSLIEYEMGFETFMKPGWIHVGLVPDTPCDNCGFREIHLFQNHPQTSPTGKRFGIFCKNCKTLKNWEGISQLVQSEIKDFLGSPVNEFRPDGDSEVIEPNTYLGSEGLNSVVDELTALLKKIDHNLADLISLFKRIPLLEETKKTDFVIVQAKPKRPPLSQEKELELRKELIDERRRIASSYGWEPMWIFHNKTIDSLVAILPETKEELLGVWGFGHKRVEEFGEEILLIIKKYLDEEIKES